MKFVFKAALAASMLLSAAAASAQGWPSQFEGVMLQGFSWGSYTGANDTRWTSLTARADEIAKYFKIVWVPNGAKAASAPSMGYDPVYWFTNYNSSFGTEAELRSMIAALKDRGTGVMADVVLNHRSGQTNWTNFPAERWNGETYRLDARHICSDDEVRYASGQATPTGAPDTGEGFDGSRDLDHTSAEVQRNCAAYCNFLLQDMGYCGFRLDMVKGYGGRYVKIYNEASMPTYSVGEYFDGSYDAVAAWIEATGRNSAAFDFPAKFAINAAFGSGDMTKLCWKANGTTDQPAGMIHYAYPRYSVTFVDNHDTYRDHNRFGGNVEAAYAFILCSPGTPCVFWDHYNANKAAIQRLIEVRNGCGVHNESAVKVLRSSRDCYMAEVTGTRGTLVVKIGSAMVAPDGYTDADIQASGNGYCVWSKAKINGGGSVGPDPGPVPDGFNVYFDNSAARWATPHIHYWGATESTWPGVAMTPAEGGVWTYTVPAGTTGLLFNAGDGDATKTADFTAVAGHIYNTNGDRGLYQGETPVPDDNYPANLYLVGNLEGLSWATANGVAQNRRDGGFYQWDRITLADSGNGSSYFSMLTALDAVDGEWEAANASDRYGSVADDTPLTPGQAATVRLYKANVDAMGATAWKVAPGTYTIMVDLAARTVLLAGTEGIGDAVADEDAQSEYFDLQGRPVAEPSAPGIYICRRGSKVTKAVVR